MRISGISGNNVDIEYKRIIQELRALGLSPTGNKEIDKSRLNAKKAELLERVKATEKVQKAEKSNEEGNDFKGTVKSLQDASEARKLLETERTGAEMLAQINRMYFGI